MKKFIVLATLIFSSASFAISTNGLISKCADKGVEKLTAQAEGLNCDADQNKLGIRGVDNRIGNPVKYVWYSMDIKCDEGPKEIQEMVQYNSMTRECI